MTRLRDDLCDAVGFVCGVILPILIIAFIIGIVVAGPPPPQMRGPHTIRIIVGD